VNHDLKTNLNVSADDYRDKILSLRERATIKNAWLKKRLETILPEIMRREGFDMWIVIAREYNEDPVMMSLLPEPMMNARRRTILVFNLREDGMLEKLMLIRYPATLYEGVWDPDKEGQYECLARIVRDKAPKTIVINISETFGFGDGLTHSEYLLLEKTLGKEYIGRAKGAERLAVGWLEKRLPEEIEVYPSLVEITHAIIAEAFST